jgi:PKD repeat protein
MLPSVGETVQFIDTSTGSPTSWRWDFGDGSQATTRDPAHTFASPGTYNVSLTASNATASSRNVSTVVIGGSASSPSASFFWSSPAIAGQTVGFFDQSTGTPASWSWTFGNGETSHDRNPQITYATQGAYVVTLTATNDAGASSISHLVPVGAAVVGACPQLSQQNVNIAHHGQTSGCGPNVDACLMNETIEFAAVYPACGAASFTWSFGDGSPTSTLSSPVHQYTSPGDYVVTAIVTNGITSVVLTEPIHVASAGSMPRRRSVH